MNAADEAWIVVDLGFGDQGKGSIVDFLVRDRRAKTVVRFSGGPQAAHTVVTADGRRHTFAQIGAGSFVPGVFTVLADTMAVQPWALLVEEAHLAKHAGVTDVFERLLVSEDAVVVTPFHRAGNRIREKARGAARHGSCGVGVGEAVSDARAGRPSIKVKDLSDHTTLTRRLADVQAAKRELLDLARTLPSDPDVRAATDDLEEPRLPGFASELLAAFRRRVRVASSDQLARHLHTPGALVFEGAHGVLLDEDVGFHPYTTWSSCTDRLAHDLLSRIGATRATTTLGVLRAYATRHGPGPFPSEWPATDPRARALDEPHNPTGPWQGAFRVGAFDLVLAAYGRAQLSAPPHTFGLALTCLDRLPRPAPIVQAYMIDGEPVTVLARGADLDAQAALTERLRRAVAIESSVPDEEAFVQHIEAHVGPVALVSRGPTAVDKAWRPSRPGPS